MTGDRRFFGKAWGSLRSTRNVFGKLCLLALLQFVPVVGQMVLLGYVLGWVRQAAWRRETPMGAHVCGRGDADFWPRGAQAWCVEVLYGLLAVAVDACVLVLLACVLAPGLPRLAESVAVGVASGVIVLADVLLAVSMYVGLARMAIYNSFGAAWQMGVNLKMAFEDFGGLLKVAFGSLGLQLLAGVGACLTTCLFLALAALLGGPVSAAFGFGALDGAATSFAALAGAGLAALPLLAVASFLLSIPYLVVSVLSWRAFGNWVAQFDVAHWGTRHDPLPFERARVAEPSPTAPVPDAAGRAEAAAADAPASAGAAQPADVPAGEPGHATAAEPSGAVEPAAAAPVEPAAVPSPAAQATPATPATAQPADVEPATSAATAAGAAQAAPEASPAPGTSGSADTEATQASPASAPVPASPRPRSHPLLVSLLCFAGAALAMALAGVVASGAGAAAGAWARSAGACLPGASAQTGLEGTWATDDGQTVTLRGDRTFAWRYADGTEVTGTYVVGDVSDRLGSGASADALSEALSMLSELGVSADAADFAGASSYELVLTASSATDASGASASSRVRGNAIDVLFVVRGGQAQIYDLASGGLGQGVSATRR